MAELKKYSEQELVSLLKQRSDHAFSYLYDNYSGALFAVILNIVPDRDLAADVLQEVYVNVFRKIDSYDQSKSRIYTWMLNIARNQSIDTVRSKGYRNSKQNHEVTEAVYEQAGSVTQNIDRIGLGKLLEKIKPEYRELIDLSYFKGLTQEEISKIQGIPLGTVKTRLRAALMQLRGLIGNAAILVVFQHIIKVLNNN
ncbi:MAG: sigma-70 family RNA polymerase sigma factor [Chitinophagaceae bacterium]